jgi:hypothetical protein
VHDACLLCNYLSVTATLCLTQLTLTPPPLGCPPRRKRKKVEEPLSDDEDHGDFDPQQLREHEEFTKVGGRTRTGTP